MSNPTFERIFIVATDLYMGNGQRSYPTVHQVRSIAKTDMNTTSEAMKLWRKERDKEKSNQSNGPETFQKAVSEASATLWSIAEHAAGETLREAQKAWDKERDDLEEKIQTLIREKEKIQIRLEAIEQLTLEQSGEILDANAYRTLAEKALEEERKKNQELTECLKIQK